MIELMVVIAIIGVLAGLLLPALNRSKARAQAIMCMNNSRNLALAWTMYSGDNNARLTYNLASGPHQMSSSQFTPPPANWVNNYMDWELSPANTNMNFLDQSLLAPYVSFSANMYHCPADQTLSQVQRSAGWTRRNRSISMNAMVGDPGGLLANGDNPGNPGYQQFLKETDFKDPSSIFVFLDEHPDSINDGYFLNVPSVQEWVDLPASYHNNGGSFSFADGHTEIHRWQSQLTIWSSQPDAVPLPLTITADFRDFNWVNNHASFATH